MQDIITKKYQEEFGIELEKYFKFNSSHFVIYKDSAETLHGHNYKVSIKIKCRRLSEENLVLDFDIVKPIVTNICNELKHCLILPKLHPDLKIEEEAENNYKIICRDVYFSIDKNSVKIIEAENITAECLAKYILLKTYEKLRVNKDFEYIEVMKLVCRVYEDKGKCGIYSIRI